MVGGGEEEDEGRSRVYVGMCVVGLEKMGVK